MTKKLAICESPAKIKSLQKYLGPEFIVKASFGHIRDLDKNELSVDLENNFKPKYTSNPDKTEIISGLKREMKKCDELYLASDFDREGEAIGWHLPKILKCDPEKTKRIIFTEITKTAYSKSS